VADILIVWPWFGWVFALFIGLCFGSFGNVVIARLPKMMQVQWQRDCAELNNSKISEQPVYNLSQPASHCPCCETPIRWYDNIPVVSYLLLRGKCRACNVRISIRYPLVELFCAFLAAMTIYHFGFNTLGWSYVVLLYLLVLLTLIDVDHMLLPDQITLPLLWLGLIGSIFWLPVTPADAIIGAAVGYLFLWSLFWLFKLATGKEGMGYGDFKLLAALGAWLGWQHLPLIILLSSVVGACFGILQLVAKNTRFGQPMPFGPYLAIAGGISLYFADVIYAWYWSIAIS